MESKIEFVGVVSASCMVLKQTPRDEKKFSLFSCLIIISYALVPVIC